MNKQVKINIPEGYEIDKKNSTFELIKFKAIKNYLPTKWESIEKIEGYYINDESNIRYCDLQNIDPENKNVFPNRELAEAALALAQLLQLREVYNNGWQPDWGEYKQNKYCINILKNCVTMQIYSISFKILAFKTEALRDKFFYNFKDLIEIAKPLL